MPFLQKTKKSGRVPVGALRSSFEGHAVGIVRVLNNSGLSLRDARRMVAREINRAGVRPTRGKGPITERTIREWDERVAEYPASLTARAYDRFIRGRHWGSFAAKDKILLHYIGAVAKRFVEKGT